MKKSSRKKPSLVARVAPVTWSRPRSPLRGLARALPSPRKHLSQSPPQPRPVIKPRKNSQNMKRRMSTMMRKKTTRTLRPRLLRRRRVKGSRMQSQTQRRPHLQPNDTFKKH
jgi:hypothetical protein